MRKQIDLGGCDIHSRLAACIRGCRGNEIISMTGVPNEEFTGDTTEPADALKQLYSWSCVWASRCTTGLRQTWLYQSWPQEETQGQV